MLASERQLLSSEVVLPRRLQLAFWIANSVLPRNPSRQAYLPSTTGLSPRIESPSESSLMAEHRAHHQAPEELIRRGRGMLFVEHTSAIAHHCHYVDDAAIDVLPDEVLLEIFDFCVCGIDDDEEWETLVHVCRRWRCIVFASPRRLGLQLVCTAGTRVREMLDIWPPFPMDLRAVDLLGDSMDNVIAALEHNDRICQFDVYEVSSDELERLVTAMQDPFPMLTRIHLESSDEVAPVLPNSLMSGSAPRLRSLTLQNIAFPALPKLLLSATGLVQLQLEIPSTGYIPPEAMADSLSSLTGLEQLQIGFRSLQPRPDEASRRLPPLTRTILPLLTSLSFKGVGEYLEVLFAWIEVPLLEDVRIYFFNPVIFDFSRISFFLGRKETVKTLDQARIFFDLDVVKVRLSSRNWTIGDTSLLLSIKCRDSVWQLGFLALNRRSSLPSPPFSHFGCFNTREGGHRYSPSWADNVGTARWRAFLQHFSAVEDLYLCEGVALCVAPALQQLAGEGEGVTEVLPALKNLFIELRRPLPPVLEATAKFLISRELSGHPIVLRCWVREQVNASTGYFHFLRAGMRG